MRGVWPIASSREYPVTLSNIGLTYSIWPLMSVMKTIFTLCSIAMCSFLSSRPAFLLSVTSRP